MLETLRVPINIYLKKRKELYYKFLKDKSENPKAKMKLPSVITQAEIDSYDIDAFIRSQLPKERKLRKHGNRNH